MRRHVAVALLAAFMSMPAAAEEDPIWRTARAVDAHAHLGTFAGYDLSLRTLLDNMKRHGVRLALVSNIDGAALPGTTGDLPEAKANEVTRAVVEENPGLRGLAWARPGDVGASAENLRPFLQRHGFVGVKLHPSMNHFAADDASVDPYMKLCAEFHRPVVVHCDEAAPIARLARRHPSVPVVLYHSGFGRDHSEAVQVVADSLKAKDCDLYLETAQVDAAAALAMVRKVGATRVVFGTDATYYGAEHYRKYTELVSLLARELSPGDFRLVMSGNAERLFGLAEVR